MKKILVSHESPNALLEDSLTYNDYTYILVHLMEQNKAYRDFHLKLANTPKYARPQIMLDNSIFELGKAFDSDKYMEWYKKIKPDFFIIPDVLEDKDNTIQSFKDFCSKYEKDIDRKNSRLVGVIQGKTYEELKECYTFMSENADYIAISFDYSYYIKDDSKDKYRQFCDGRIQLVWDLIEDDVWNWRKPHHLLGASLAEEFRYYYNVKNIRSLDTSNPVVAGLLGYTYVGDFGLNFKPSIKLADMVDYKVDNSQYRKILYNVEQFKQILNY